jgi:hypothetical protein
VPDSDNFAADGRQAPRWREAAWSHQDGYTREILKDVPTGYEEKGDGEGRMCFEVDNAW